MNVVNLPKVAVLRLSILALACVAFLISQSSPAQQQQDFQQPSAVNPVQWIAGPKKVNLGDTAEINVPEGYQFLDAQGGSFFLQANHNPVPKNLIGILAPTSTKWFAVIEYSGIGYVKDTDASQLNASAMLKKFQSLISRQNEANSKDGIPAIASADWELKPVYDPAKNKLEWAVRAVTGKDAAQVNYSVQLFGRQGVLEVIAVQPYQADFDLSPLREIVKGMSFREGERYTDYKAGDALAKVSVAQLAANEGKSGSATTSAAKSGHMALWIGVGVAVLLLVGASTLVVKNFLSQGSRSEVIREQNASSPSPRQPDSPGQGQTAIAQAMSVAPAGNSNVTFVKHQGASSRQSIGRNGRSPKINGRKRKRQYNFHLFYSDMIMNLTRWNYLGNFGSFSSDYAHGLANDPVAEAVADTNNGASANDNHSNGKQTESPVPTGTMSPDAAKLLAMETSKLIENQQKLIEGQRKLIEEQNKLIQEKSKLIDLESSVLEKQSELIEEQGLL